MVTRNSQSKLKSQSFTQHWTFFFFVTHELGVPQRTIDGPGFAKIVEGTYEPSEEGQEPEYEADADGLRIEDSKGSEMSEAENCNNEKVVQRPVREWVMSLSFL